MDETSPVYQNFLNRIKFSRPIREATRRISASKFLQRDGDTGAKMDMPSTVRNIDKKINHNLREKVKKNYSIESVAEKYLEVFIK